MQFGRVGPRGRRFPKVNIQRQRSVIVKSKFISTRRGQAKARLSKWINYCVKDKTYELEKEKEHGIQELLTTWSKGRQAEGQETVGDKSTAQAGQDRAGEPEYKLPPELLREKDFFNGERDDISADEAKKLIADNFGRNVGYHQMILSPGQRGIDPYEYAREQIKTLEHSLGHQVTWVGNVHRDTGPDQVHINITIAGKIKDWTPPAVTHDNREYDVQDIDLARLDRDDKLYATNGNWYTKYHSLDDLLALDKYLNESKNYIDHPEYQKLWSWIGTKQDYGDKTFGTPPLKEKETDYSKIPTEDKIQTANGIFSKYDDLKKLEELSARDLQSEGTARIPDDDRQKLEGWMGAKIENGDAVYGKAPQKYVEDKDQGRPKEQKELKAHELTGKLELDMSKIPEDERLNVNGKLITKYTGLEKLREASKYCNERPENHLPQDQYLKLRSWINEKERRGEDAFGYPPYKRIDPEKEKEQEKDEGKKRKGKKQEREEEKRKKKLPSSSAADVSKKSGDEREAVEGGSKGADQSTTESKPQSESGETGGRTGPTNEGQERSGEAAGAAEGKTPDKQQDLTRQTIEPGSTDAVAKKLIDGVGGMRSVEAVNIDRDLDKADRFIERHAKQEALKSAWNGKGDVFLDKKSLDEMRKDGDYYIHNRTNLDREIERAIDRELGRTSIDHLREQVARPGRANTIAQNLGDAAAPGAQDPRRKGRDDEESDGARGR